LHPGKCENAALFLYGLSRQNNRKVTKIKPLYPEKSRGPHQVSFVRVQQSHSDDGKLKAHVSKVAAALLHAHNEAWCGERLFW